LLADTHALVYVLDREIGQDLLDELRRSENTPMQFLYLLAGYGSGSPVRDSLWIGLVVRLVNDEAYV
jgi:hypothetical protein